MGVLLIMQLAVGITAAVQHDKLDGVVSKGWDSAADSTKAYFELLFSCCGYHNVTDRAHYASCPVDPNSNLASDETPSGPEQVAPGTPGCATAFADSLSQWLRTIAGVAIALSIFELFSVVMAYVLAARVKKEQRRYMIVEQDDPSDLLGDGL